MTNIGFKAIKQKMRLELPNLKSYTICKIDKIIIHQLTFITYKPITGIESIRILSFSSKPSTGSTIPGLFG